MVRVKSPVSGAEPVPEDSSLSPQMAVMSFIDPAAAAALSRHCGDVTAGGLSRLNRGSAPRHQSGDTLVRHQMTRRGRVIRRPRPANHTGSLPSVRSADPATLLSRSAAGGQTQPIMTSKQGCQPGSANHSAAPCRPEHATNTTEKNTPLLKACQTRATSADAALPRQTIGAGWEHGIQQSLGSILEPL